MEISEELQEILLDPDFAIILQSDKLGYWIKDTFTKRFKTMMDTFIVLKTLRNGTLQGRKRSQMGPRSSRVRVGLFGLKSVSMGEIETPKIHLSGLQMALRTIKRVSMGLSRSKSRDCIGNLKVWSSSS